MRSFLKITLLLVWAVLMPSVLGAQSLVQLNTSTSSDSDIDLEVPLTEAEAEALVSRMSDTQVRDILLEQLGTKADDAAAESRGVSDFFFHFTTGALQSVLTPVQSIPALISGQSQAISNFWQTYGAAGIFGFLGLFLLVALVALAAEVMFYLMTRKWHDMSTMPSEDKSLRQTLSVLFKRLCRDILGVAVFIAVAGIVSRIVMPPQMLVYSSLIGPWLIAFPRIAWSVGRFIMAPENPAYRLVNASDHTARAIVFHNVCFALVIGFSQFIGQFNTLNGVPEAGIQLGFWLNAAVHVYLAILIWRYRQPFYEMMRGKETVTTMENRVAHIFPYFAIAVTIGTWWVVNCLLYTSPSPRDLSTSRMPSSA